MTDYEVGYIEGLIERSRERRASWFGQRKTVRAETAELMLAIYAPMMLEEIKNLREGRA